MKILSRLFGAPPSAKKRARGLGVDVAQAVGPASAMTLVELLRRLADAQPGYETWTVEDLTAALRRVRIPVVPVREGGRTALGVRQSAVQRALGGAR
ncbi:hypothetical protein AB0C10_36650 [Microbispora amethystogenes]|uniref:hypothetical protein n=1 Tax=Microbispora amethystogenes TaxID=1427754 RepID=UPI0033DC4974